jgi:hypothetical protein
MSPLPEIQNEVNERVHKGTATMNVVMQQRSWQQFEQSLEACCVITGAQPEYL